MASVKDNIFNVQKGMQLIATYKEQISKNILKSSQASLVSQEHFQSESTVSINHSEKLPESTEMPVKKKRVNTAE